MTEREQYEAWFRDFYKQEPMPELGAPAHDFCWAGYRAGAASRDAEIDDLGESLAQVKLKNELLIDERDQLREQVKMLRDAIVVTCCDPDGRVCIRVSDGDREILQTALAATESKE